MKKLKLSWVILIGFIGIILGTLFANGMERIAPESLTVFALDQYTVTEQMLEHKRNFIWYIIRQRGIQGVLATIVMALCNPMVLLFLFVFLFGFAWGMFLSLETMRLGIQGLFFAMSCFLPQGLFYAIGFLMFLICKLEVQETGEVGMRRLYIFLLPLVLFLVGIVMEIWVSPALICSLLP